MTDPMIAVKVVGDDGTKIVTEPYGHIIVKLMGGSWRPRPSDTLAHMTGFDIMRVRSACEAANDCDPVDDGEALAETLTMALSSVECIPPVIRWTTAEKGYDYGRTIELEEGVLSYGTHPPPSSDRRMPRTWRKVAIHPKDVDMQEGRYGSGLHPSREEDPRETERREIESMDKWRAQMAEQKAGEAEVAKWLVEAPLLELEAEFEKDEGLRRYLTYNVLKTAIKARKDEETRKIDEAKYTILSAKIPKDGTIIIEDVFTYSRTGDRPPWKSGEIIHYGLQVDSFYGQPLDEIRVVFNTDRIWSLYNFVELLENRVLRFVKAEDAPPQTVMKRIGYGRIQDVHKFEDVWVVREPYGSVNAGIVLDQGGRVVRKKVTAQRALDYLWNLERSKF